MDHHPDCLTEILSSQDKQKRKYYIYSNYARRIQLAYLKYKFKKFYKDNYLLFRRLCPGHLPLPAAIIKYKILYYRNWSTYTLDRFIKSNRY